ncbi:hypothetical protein Rt10032_c05g2475 [Rhodotorula toruloides]|uniref:Uncharacterized protein n=1 Tax=Rhodotorula toruloides TaxID=5286 RepID=A0A511KDL4_RHOTO|nr:hypothetical protein Rt10032_c05g2475 [Rhodotorula toruloides]
MKAVTPEAIEAEMLTGQTSLRHEAGQVERKKLAGTEVCESSSKASEEYGPEEVIYTATPSYNPALMVGVAFTMGVFCLTLADLARVGIVRPDAETGEFANAPAWKRYTFATGAGAVGVAVLHVTKITLRRSPAAAKSALPFPPDSRLCIYHIYSPIAQQWFKKPPRTIPIDKCHLLGAISASPKPYHPQIKPIPPREGSLRAHLAKLRKRFFPDDEKPLPSATKQKYSHAPLIVEGDWQSYSLQIKRAQKPFDSTGAWCKNWDAFERALLGVDETRWSGLPR